jgi:hypothetical protein
LQCSVQNKRVIQLLQHAVALQPSTHLDRTFSGVA